VAAPTEEEDVTGPNDPTIEVTPSTQYRALAFVGRVLHVGFLITPAVEELIEPFGVMLQYALRLHGLDVVQEPGVGWRVVRRLGR
jgi:hypothetical protein